MDKKWIGIVIFIILIVIISGIKIIGDSTKEPVTVQETDVKGLTTVYVATGGGKENFLNDERVTEIFRKKYKLNVIFDNWSNGKTVLWPLVREAVGKGNRHK